MIVCVPSQRGQLLEKEKLQQSVHVQEGHQWAASQHCLITIDSRHAYVLHSCDTAV